MNSDRTIALAETRSHPVVRILSAFPIACFTCALATDITYVSTANMMWTDFSAWLLAAGMAGAVLASIAGLVAWARGRRRGVRRSAWPIVIGSLLVLVIGLFNNFVHSRDAWTSVMPEGLALSAVTVVVMLGTIWIAAVQAGRIQGAAAPYAGARR